MQASLQPPPPPESRWHKRVLKVLKGLIQLNLTPTWLQTVQENRLSCCIPSIALFLQQLRTYVRPHAHILHFTGIFFLKPLKQVQNRQFWKRCCCLQCREHCLLCYCIVGSTFQTALYVLKLVHLVSSASITFSKLSRHSSMFKSEARQKCKCCPGKEPSRLDRLIAASLKRGRECLVKWDGESMLWDAREKEM